MNQDKNASFVRVNACRSVPAFSLLVIIVSVAASVARSQEVQAPNTLPVNTVIANVKVGKSPVGVVVSPDSNSVYVANFSSNTVSVIDAQTNTKKKSILVGTAPYDLAISSDGSTLYVSQFTSPGAVTVIDLTNGNSIQTITGISPYPLGIDLSPDGTQLWVGCQAPPGMGTTGNIDRIDTANNQVLGSVTVPDGCERLAFTPDGNKVYATGPIGIISVVSTATGSVTATIPESPRYIEESAGMAMKGQRAYVLVNVGYNELTGLLLIINTATDNVIKRVHFSAEAGDRPALLPNAPYLYIPKNTPSAVTLFDTKTNTRRADGVTCAYGAYDVAIAPNGARAYVTDGLANTVTVIQIQ